jgi:hypothetical protein
LILYVVVALVDAGVDYVIDLVLDVSGIAAPHEGFGGWGFRLAADIRFAAI